MDTQPLLRTLGIFSMIAGFVGVTITLLWAITNAFVPYTFAAIFLGLLLIWLGNKALNAKPRIKTYPSELEGLHILGKRWLKNLANAEFVDERSRLVSGALVTHCFFDTKVGKVGFDLVASAIPWAETRHLVNYAHVWVGITDVITMLRPHFPTLEVILEKQHEAILLNIILHADDRLNRLFLSYVLLGDGNSIWTANLPVPKGQNLSS